MAKMPRFARGSSLDRPLRAVGHREPRLALGVRRHGPVAEHLPESLVVVAEHIGGQVVAAAVALAALGADLHFHRVAPVCVRHYQG